MAESALKVLYRICINSEEDAIQILRILMHRSSAKTSEVEELLTVYRRFMAVYPYSLNMDLPRVYLFT